MTTVTPARRSGPLPDGARHSAKTGSRVWVLVTTLALVAGAAAGGLAWDQRRRPDPTPAMTTEPLTTPSGVDVVKRQEAVEAVLRDRATAVLKRDPRAFVAAVDPAKSKLVARHRQLYKNLVQFRFAELSYTIEREQYDQSFQRRYGQSAYAVQVTMRYRIRDIDARPVRTMVGYVFVLHGGRWILTDDNDLDRDLPPGSHREPWDTGAVLVKRGDRVLVVVEPREKTLASRLVRRAESAVHAVNQRWPREWDGSGLVIALADRKVRTADYTVPKNAEDAVAMATAVYRTLPGQSTAEGDRGGSYVVINPRYRNKISARVLAHEFTHVATAPYGSSAPRWIVEGVADYIEYLPMDGERDLDLDKYRGKIRKTYLAKAKNFPADAVFYTSMVDSYAIGWYAVDYLVHRYGDDRFADLYADLAAQGFSQVQRDLVLRQHLKLTEKQLFRELKRPH